MIIFSSPFVEIENIRTHTTMGMSLFQLTTKLTQVLRKTGKIRA